LRAFDMRRQSWCRCQTQPRGTSCTLHVRDGEDEDGETHSRDVQASECPFRSREETGGMSMRRCGAGIQCEKVEARLRDMSSGRERLDGNLMDFLVGTR
jgi:hypothetical protein